MSAIYIQRVGGGYRETVDSVEILPTQYGAGRREAWRLLCEYRLADAAGRYYLSRRACKGWQVAK